MPKQIKVEEHPIAEKRAAKSKDTARMQPLQAVTLSINIVDV